MKLGGGPPPEEIDVIPLLGAFSLTSFFLRLSANCVALSCSALFLLFNFFRAADCVEVVVRGLEPNDCLPACLSEDEESEPESDSESDSELDPLSEPLVFFDTYIGVVVSRG